MSRELTGRHVLIIAILAFATIVAANMTMLFAATGSFPGLVVKSAYVEGQGWNDRAEAQRALGLASEVSYHKGALVITIRNAEGRVIDLPDLTIQIGRPATDVEDQVLSAGSQGVYPVSLGSGQWQIDLKAPATGYRSTVSLYVPERG
ncbi:MAG: FixH family protein [Pseudomonadota bacterium]